MTVQIINLPRPISVNALFTNVPGKGRVKSSRYRTWLRAAGWEVKAARVKQITGPAQIILTIPENYRGDADNCMKAVLDILQETGAVINDKQFRKLTIQYGPVEGMRAEIAPIEVVKEEAA